MQLDQTYVLVIAVLVVVLIIVQAYLSKKERLVVISEPEKWSAYLQYCMDSCYDIISAKYLATYMTSNTIMRSEDKEFVEMSNTFLIMLKTKLGRFYKDIYLRFIFDSEDQFTDHALTYLISRVYRDLAENVVMTENAKEGGV